MYESELIEFFHKNKTRIDERIVQLIGEIKKKPYMIVSVAGKPVKTKYTIGDVFEDAFLVIHCLTGKIEKGGKLVTYIEWMMEKLRKDIINIAIDYDIDKGVSFEDEDGNLSCSKLYELKSYITYIYMDDIAKSR